MKTSLVVVGIIVLAGLAMGLPYILRRGSGGLAPSPTPVLTPTATVTALPTSYATPSPSPALRPTPTLTQRPTQSPLATPKPTPTPSPVKTATPSPAAAAAEPVSAVISNFAFAPATLTIAKGTKVTWTNNDSVSHTVTGDNGGPASSLLSPGASYSFTFDTPGTFAYHCSPHPFMKGAVTVTP